MPSEAELSCKVPALLLVSVPPVSWEFTRSRLPLPTEKVLPAVAKARVLALIEPPVAETAVAELRAMVPAE